jgi:hypothetical protein
MTSIANVLVTYHELRCGCSFKKTLLYESISENDLRKFDSKIIFIGSTILSDRWPNANRRNRDVLPNILFRTTELGT